MLVTDDVYLRNMAALWRVDPRLAYAIDQLPIDASVRMEPSRAGPPTALVDLPDGRRHYLHSRYDPSAEADQFCRTQTDGDSQALVAVLCGLGLGHHVAPLLAQLWPHQRRAHLAKQRPQKRQFPCRGKGKT